MTRGKGRGPIVGLLLGVMFFMALRGSCANPLPDWVMLAAKSGPATYPAKATSIVLLDDRLITVGPGGQATERERRVLRILRPQGREDAHIVATYSKDEKLDYLHVWSIAPDGRQFTVKDQDIHDEALGQWGILYDDLRGRTITPPGADPGGIVAYEYQRHVVTYGAQEQYWSFQQDVPIVHSALEIDLPPTWNHYAAWLHHEPVSAVEVAPNHFRWELENIPAIDLTDVSMAPSPYALAGRMVVHYAAEPLPAGDQRWTQIGNWYDTLASGRTEAPLEIASKSRQIAGASDFKGKIQGVAGFMQREIRYVGIEIGIGGLQPHPAVDVFKYRYGDCKDKVTLLISMLNAVGVRATWVLVDTSRGFVDPGLPSIRGNHAIAAIEMPAGYSDPDLKSVVSARSGKHYLIFDPTDTYTPIGLLSSHLQGSFGILVAGNDSQVIQLPVLNPDANLLERAASFQLSVDGSLEGTVTESRFGEAARRFRRLYGEESEKEQHEDMERRLQRDFSNFTIESSAAQNATEVGKSVLLKFSFTAAAYAQPTGDLLLVRPRVMGHDALPFHEADRIYPIDFGQTGTWRDTIDVTLPPGYVVDDLPQGVDLDLGFARYKSEVKASGDVLHYSREYVVRQIDLAPDKFRDVSKLMGIINADETTSAVLKKSVSH
jgi:Domain of Unknown Function with PDB structure (DUF3857)